MTKDTDGQTLLMNFAAEVGMRVKPLNRLIEEHNRFENDIRHQVNRANVAIRATGQLLRWTPLVLVIGEQLMGINVFYSLTHNPLGLGLLVYAGLLSVGTGKLLKRFNGKVTKIPTDPGVWFAAVAQALRDGVGATRVAIALRFWGGFGGEHRRRMEAIYTGAAWEVEEQLALAIREGSPIADYLERLAEERRGKVRELKELEVAMLPIKLLVPVGLLLLPAFMGMVLGPVLLGVLGSGHTTI